LRVILALGYPEKRKTLRLTEKQEAELERLQNSKESQENVSRMDQVTTSQALKLLTPRQNELLKAEIDKRGW
jgi:hypothetical protein